MQIVKPVRPPRKLSRLLYRLPIHLYRIGLGGLFGSRMLLVNHLGRVTGRPRQVVLEVIAHDRLDGSYVVVSGWGPKAAWYRNLQHSPDVTIQVGRRTTPVTSVPLPAAEAADIITPYLVEHRAAAKRLLPRLMGYAVDGSEADFRAVAEQMPAIRFVPRT